MVNKKIISYLQNNNGLLKGESYLSVGLKFGLTPPDKERGANDPTYYNQSITKIVSKLWCNYLKKQKEGIKDLNYYIKNRNTEQGEAIKKDADGAITYKGSKNITSLKEFEEFFEVDTKKYEVVDLTFGSYSTPMKLKTQEIQTLNDKDKILYNQTPIQIVSYTCRGKIIKKRLSEKKHIKKLLKKIKTYNNPYKGLKNIKTSGVGVFCSADYHLGLMSKSYNPKIFSNRLNQMAAHINKENKKEVYLVIAGDLLEAGALMHQSQAYELDFNFTGIQGGRLVYELLRENLFNNIINLKGIYIVHGNHDRLTANKKDSNPNSSIGKLLYYFCKDNMKDIEVRYERFILTFVKENIGYIVTHGDLGMTKKPLQLITDYGFGKEVVYHILISAHYHSRKSKTSHSSKAVKYKDTFLVVNDSFNYRAIVLPSLCDTNQYAKDLGFSGTAGFLSIERAQTPSGEKINNVKIIDTPLL